MSASASGNVWLWVWPSHSEKYESSVAMPATRAYVAMWWCHDHRSWAQEVGCEIATNLPSRSLSGSASGCGGGQGQGGVKDRARLAACCRAASVLPPWNSRCKIELIFGVMLQFNVVWCIHSHRKIVLTIQSDNGKQGYKVGRKK